MNKEKIGEQLEKYIDLYNSCKEPDIKNVYKIIINDLNSLLQNKNNNYTGDRKLRQQSGHIKSKNRLDCFLYLLLRDNVPAGVIGNIVKQIRENSNNKEYLFGNGWLAEYAIYVRRFLNGEDD